MKSHLYHRKAGLAKGALVSLALALAGCGGAAGGATLTPPSVPGASVAPVLLGKARPFFVPGEMITWTVTFQGIEGGRARLAVGFPGTVDGRHVIVLRAEAESSGLVALFRKAHDNASSWIDLESGIPARTESESNIGDGKEYVVHTTRPPGQARADLTIWRGGGAKEQKKSQRLPGPDTHDPLSALLLMRGWEAVPGARAQIYSLGGARVWRTVLTAERSEEIDTGLGRQKALRIAGVSTRMTPELTEDKSRPARSFTVWLSDDAQRIPLKISASTEFGEISISATTYTSGEAAATD